MVTDVAIDVVFNNFERVQNKLRRFPRSIDEAMRLGMEEWFFDDFKPMLNRVIRGFRAAEVPAINSPRWAAIKAARYGIRHSLGYLSGDLHRGAMAVNPTIRTTQMNRTILRADYSNVPETGVPYLGIVHEGLDGLHQAYPMVEATRRMTHKRLISKVESRTSEAWRKTGG